MSDMKFFLLWACGLKKPFSSTTKKERLTLYRHVAGKKNVVEIGVYHGVNTKKFCQLMDPYGVLYAVDPFFKGRAGFSTMKVIAHYEVGKCENRNIKWMECLGHEAARIHASESSVPIDFIFIDGDHSYAGIKSDWEAWRPLLSSGCIIALHDSEVSPNTSANADTGSVIYTKEVISNDVGLKKLEVVDSLSVFERI